VELPITIVFEPPSRAELRAVMRSGWRTWGLTASLVTAAIGILLAVVSASRADALATDNAPTLGVRSRPSGAEVWLDGQSAGRTPSTVIARAGLHRLQLKTPDAADVTYRLHVDAPSLQAGFEPLLWRRQPRVSRLRAAVPGASLEGVHLSGDGAVNLVQRMGAGQELQAWRFDPNSGTYALLVPGVPGLRLALAPDGARVGYLGREIGPPATTSSERDQILWLVGTDEATAPPRALWRAPSDEVLLDVAWVPDGYQLLVTTGHQMPAGGARSRLWLIDAESGVARLLLTLPSQVVPGALSWRPDGRAVALIAHAGTLNALCLLELDGAFRYLADLEPSEDIPLPYPPVSWSADGQRALIAAPPQDPALISAGWLQPAARRGVYVTGVDSAPPRLVAEADTPLAVWREDGQVVALGSTRAGALGIDLVGEGPRPERLLDVPFRLGTTYAAEWDTTHGQLLLANRTGGNVEYALVQIGLEDQP